MNKSIKIQYEGMGFVEALIAIMVVGVSSVVLMQIATNTLKDMIQNETIDTMTQYAVGGATMAQNIAMQEKTTGVDVFPPYTPGYCHVIDENEDEEGQYHFRKNGSDYTMYNFTDSDERDVYRAEALVQEDDDDLFFRIYCIEEYNAVDTYAIVKIIVGQSKSGNGSITNGSNVKDYTYLTVVNL